MKMLRARLFLAAALAAFITSPASSTLLGQQDAEIRKLIAQLHEFRWGGPELVGESPTTWSYDFTPPMLSILRIGNAAQDQLLANLDDTAIKDQVIILLGGIGDERAIQPLINAMEPVEGLERTKAYRAKINRCANLALTNITVADVIWHYGGGIVVERCKSNPQLCWAAWWHANQRTFTVKTVIQSKNYSNYPNYGIHQRLDSQRR